ncbi:MAG: RagB/SusD family nutrient uptake outer membrane protein [Alistipes sp.]|nr:RagB/SusD family nutrient uptake outer membrane protein [Alistipes sp.]
MKKYIVILISMLSLSLASCDSFLDRQPDEPKTSENIFNKMITTRQYLVNVYSWINNETDPSGQNNIWEACSDECSVSFGSRWHRLFNNGTWMVSSNPSVSSNSFLAKNYSLYWKGIREASYFMENVGRCTELTPTEVAEWSAEARFLRAYYYFCLMRMWGPVHILGENCADYTSEDLRNIDRNTWDECVDWVCKELDAAADVLPLEQSDEWLGRATKGAALAVKARLLLYSARPLFNGNPMYAGIKNYYGKDLFPQTYDPNKWVLAAEAAQEVMDLGVYEIVGENAGDPYTSWRKVFLERWNKEIIFARQNTSYNWRVATTPEVAGGKAYGGVGVTQKLVDAFAMANGKYPFEFDNYNAANPTVADGSGYPALADEMVGQIMTHPILECMVKTPRMYCNREPRFYMSIFWNGLTWKGGSNSAVVQMHRGGNSYSGTSDNYTATGYLPYKFTNPKFDTKNASGAWEPITWPLFRYAEILLNYAEAVNEAANAGVGSYTINDALTQLNRVRVRAGVPAIESLYAEANTYEGLKKFILRERQIELNFENHRYFDTRTNLLSEVEDAGDVYGMNVEATNSTVPTSTPSETSFWRRTIIPHDGGNRPSTRVFTKRQYLLPYYQSEVDRLNNLTQNPFY